MKRYFEMRIFFIISLMVLSGCKLSIETGGLGSVVSNVPIENLEVRCENSCVYTVENEFEGILSAIPAEGSVFVGWEGICNGSLAPCYLHITQPLVDLDDSFTIAAQFELESNLQSDECVSRSLVVFVSANGTEAGNGSECEPVLPDDLRLKKAKVIVLLDHGGIIEERFQLLPGQQLLGAGDDGKVFVRLGKNRKWLYTNLGGRPVLSLPPFTDNGDGENKYTVVLADRTLVRGIQLQGPRSISGKSVEKVQLFDLTVDMGPSEYAGINFIGSSRIEINSVKVNNGGRAGIYLEDTVASIIGVDVTGDPDIYEGTGLYTLDAAFTVAYDLTFDSINGTGIALIGDTGGMRLSNISISNMGLNGLVFSNAPAESTAFVKDLSVDSVRSYGVRFFSGGSVQIDGLDITETAIGISVKGTELEGVAGVLLNGYRFANGRAGIEMGYASEVAVNDFYIDGIEAGISVNNSGIDGKNQFSNGSIRNSKASAIGLYASTDTFFRNIDIDSAGQQAVLVWDSAGNFDDLRISDAPIGFRFLGFGADSANGAGNSTVLVDQVCTADFFWSIDGELIVNGADCL